MLYLTCSMIPSVDIARYRLPRAKYMCIRKMCPNYSFNNHYSTIIIGIHLVIYWFFVVVVVFSIYITLLCLGIVIGHAYLFQLVGLRALLQSTRVKILNHAYTLHNIRNMTPSYFYSYCGSILNYLLDFRQTYLSQKMLFH